MVQKMGGKAVEIFSDSRLVVGQVGGEFEARDVRMQEYLNQVRYLQSGFKSFSLLHISLGVETRMLTLWPFLQPPKHRVYLGSSLLKTCANLLR